MRTQSIICDQCGKAVGTQRIAVTEYGGPVGEFPMMNPDLNIAGEKVGKWFGKPQMDFCSPGCLERQIALAFPRNM